MGHAALQNLKINDRSFWLPAHLAGEIASKHDTNNNNSSSNIGGWSYVSGPKPVLLTQFILIASSSIEKLCPHF